MSTFNSSAHKLAGSNPAEVGGLILKNKPKTDLGGSKESDVPMFKKPGASRLGLDRLARKKREEREAEEAMNFPEKKSRLHTKGDEVVDDSSARISFGRSSRSQDSSKDRKYRGALVETPSYTGGVSEDALQKIQSRLLGRERASQGVLASSSSSRSRDKEDLRGSRRDDR
jgi:pre-mRNA-splicing factor ATP-dependent RNA helicase DHX38/PRP16